MDHHPEKLNLASGGRTAQARRLTTFATCTLALLGLIWVLHDVRYSQMKSDFLNIQWRWAAAAVAADIVSYFCQGARWRALLPASARISILRATQAIYAGLFVNEVLPLRLGEVVRLFLVKRWTGAAAAKVIPSMIFERLIDGFWLALAVGVTLFLIPLPRDVAVTADVFGACIIILTGLFVLLAVCKPRFAHENVHSRPLKLLMKGLDVITVEIQAIGISWRLGLACLHSLFLLVFQALSFWLAMHACGLPLSFLIGSAVFLIVHFGTLIPNAPANIGSYQFFCVVGLTFFGVEKTAAAGFSLVVFILLTAPLWLLGFFAFSASGNRLADWSSSALTSDKTKTVQTAI